MAGTEDSADQGGCFGAQQLDRRGSQRGLGELGQCRLLGQASPEEPVASHRAPSSDSDLFDGRCRV